MSVCNARCIGNVLKVFALPDIMTGVLIGGAVAVAIMV